MQIHTIIPDAESLLALHPSELAGVLLELMQNDSKSSFHPGVISDNAIYKNYDPQCLEEVKLAVMEAWCFLVGRGLLVPSPGSQNGWHVLSRTGRQIKSSADFRSFVIARMFPRDLLHPKITEKSFSAYLLGDYETCVFNAFKQVEVAIRDRSGSGFANYYGVDLVRKAFHLRTGPLTLQSEPEAEKEAIMHLVAGAIGRFKNPSSHRHVAISSGTETIEMLCIASHLLRVVEDRG